jgi:hypothetical protein
MIHHCLFWSSCLAAAAKISSIRREKYASHKFGTSPREELGGFLAHKKLLALHCMATLLLSPQLTIGFTGGGDNSPHFITNSQRAFGVYNKNV